MNELVPVLAAQGLRRSYREGGGAALTVLENLDLTVAPGERLAIIGQSGSGKSTLLHLLGALDRPDGGTLRWGSADPLALGDGARAAARNRQRIENCWRNSRSRQLAGAPEGLLHRLRESGLLRGLLLYLCLRRCWL